MKEFGYPLPYDDFWELCDVNPDSCFHKPFDLGDGETGLANGRMALRTTQAVLDEDKRVNEAARERLESLRWDFFDFPDRTDLRPGVKMGWERSWRMLRDRAGILAGPEVPAWEPSLDPEKQGGFDFVDRPRVTVGEERILMPVSTMQLLRRLPNCEVFVGNNYRRRQHGNYFDWIYCRFTGGRGMACSAMMRDGQPTDGEVGKYGVWTPKVDQGIERMGGGLIR